MMLLAPATNAVSEVMLISQENEDLAYNNNEPGEIELLFNAPCSQILDGQIELEIDVNSWRICVCKGK